MIVTATEKATPEEKNEAPKKPKTATKTGTRTRSGTAKTVGTEKAATGSGTGTSAKRSEGGTAKSTGTAAKKTGTAKTPSTRSTGAKSGTTRTASASSSAKKSSGAKPDDEIKKAASGTKKPATGAKKPATGQKAATKKTASEPSPRVAPEKEQDTTDNAPFGQQTEAPAYVPIALPSGAMIEAGGKAVSDAHPPLDFPEKMMRNFFLRIGVIIAVLAVLVASAFIYYTRPARYTEQTSSVNFLFVPAEGKTLILVNGTVRGDAAGELGAFSHNGRGDTYAAMIGEALYLIRGKNIIHIADGVLDFVLAADGGALAYRTAPSSLYYRETGKRDTASLISKNCNGSAYCLSSNGKELAYTAVDETGTVHLRVESYSGNRPYIEGTAGLSPIAISNKSRYVYYTDTEGGLYLFDREGAQKIKCAAAPDLTTLIFNRDFTELLFTENGGTVFFGQGERRQIVGVSSTEYLELLPNRRVASRTVAGGTQYMLKSFYKNYFLHAEGTGKKLTYLDRKGNLTDVSFVDSAETVTVTDKGVYFLQTSVNGENISRELYHVKSGKTAASRIEWGVTAYCTNIDGSRVMFTGFEDALYIYRAEAGATRICDSIDPASLRVTADDLFCFYRTDGVLTVSDNGGELRDLSSGVSHFSSTVHVLFFATDKTEEGTFSVHVNYRGERLSECVATGVSKIQ